MLILGGFGGYWGVRGQLCKLFKAMPVVVCGYLFMVICLVVASPGICPKIIQLGEELVDYLLRLYVLYIF